MVTKEEFERQWKESKNEIREIYIGLASGTLANSYEYFTDNSDVKFMKLFLFDHQVAVIYLGDVLKVG